MRALNFSHFVALFGRACSRCVLLVTSRRLASRHAKRVRNMRPRCGRLSSSPSSSCLPSSCSVSSIFDSALGTGVSRRCSCSSSCSDYFILTADKELMEEVKRIDNEVRRSLLFCSLYKRVVMFHQVYLYELEQDTFQNVITPKKQTRHQPNFTFVSCQLPARR